jgi:hypothetical protein
MIKRMPLVFVPPRLFSVNGEITMSDVTQSKSAVTPHSEPQAEPIHQIWPKAMVGIGLGVTAAWMCFLGYGLVRLVGLLI